MTREELKEMLREVLPDMYLDSVMSLIDEYTKPKKKTKTLEERKSYFMFKVGEHCDDYNEEFNEEFVGYWTEHNDNGKKMRFEMSKNQPFNIKRRLATWKKNQKNYGKSNTKKGIDNNSLDNWINS